MHATTSALIGHALKLTFGDERYEELTGALFGPVWRKTLDFYSQLPLDDPRFDDMALGRAMFHGLHAFQGRLYTCNGRVDRALDVSEGDVRASRPDWELLSQVEALGKIIVAIVGTNFSPALAELQRQWLAAGDDANAQIHVCEALLKHLREPPRETGLAEDAPERNEDDLGSHWIDDYVDQGPERIIPTLFLKEGGRPNCLGKGMVLTHFFQRVGATVFGLTPITSYYDSAEDVLLGLVELIEEYAAKRGVPLRDRLKKTIRERRVLAAAREQTPERFHMAVAVQLADGRWFQIDPHQSCSGVFKLPPSINGAAQASLAG